MKPPRSILDPSFRYVGSAQTDVASTFRRIERERKAKEEAERNAATEHLHKVIGQIKNRKRA